MTRLAEIADRFGVSEPVFKITLDATGDIQYTVKNRYKPHESDDPVERLVAETYTENLDKRAGKFIAHVDLNRAYATITNTVLEIVVDASTLKNPKQSKLYKWLCEREPLYHNPAAEGYIALYRYIVANDIVGTRDNTNPHARNVIAILELMKEKYEDKTNSHQ